MKKSRVRAVLCVATLAGGALLASGCYTKVIDANGIGADQQHPRQTDPTRPLRARDLWSGSGEKDK